MKIYDLGAFCNTRAYTPGQKVTLPVGEEVKEAQEVTLPVGEEVKEAVKEALKEAEKNPNTPQKIQEGIQKLKDEERNNINIISTTNFNLTTDDVAIIALLTAFLAVINGPGGAITFGAFLTIAAGFGLDSKYSETAQDLLKKIPSPNPQGADATALEKTKENQTAVG